MDRKKRLLPVLAIVLLGAVILGLLYYIIPLRYHLNHREFYDAAVDTVKNPLMGYAPPAENTEECENASLVFIGLTWAEWEPEMGRFDIAGFEETYHISRWKEEGKHAVLRFIADYPGETSHMDIPEWLYNETRDGRFYETSYGSGYAPDYANSFFRERHKRAIEALAEYCSEDDFVAYVELGSLGHWGEWHVNFEEDSRIPLLPDVEICWEYVLDYSDHFYNALLLMRRNYPMVTDAGLGVYNDMVGASEDTEEWMEWLQNGGVQETQGAALELEATEDYWEIAPVGGEFTSSVGMEEILTEGLSETIDMVRAAHMTFLGPNCPEVPGDAADSSSAAGGGASAVADRTSAVDSVSGADVGASGVDGADSGLEGAASLIERNLGYRLYISELQTRFDFGRNRIRVILTWGNNGVAPCYWDWSVSMNVYDASGKRIYWQSLDLSISSILPGTSVQVEGEIPYSSVLNKGYSIGIVITSPDEKEHIRLGMQDVLPDEDGVHILYTYEG